jgi:hypothetical protein
MSLIMVMSPFTYGNLTPLGPLWYYFSNRILWPEKGRKQIEYVPLKRGEGINTLRFAISVEQTREKYVTRLKKFFEL